MKKKGLLLVNLGSPESTKKDIRAFLKQFLSDRRVIEKSPQSETNFIFGNSSI